MKKKSGRKIDSREILPTVDRKLVKPEKAAQKTLMVGSFPGDCTSRSYMHQIALFDTYLYDMRTRKEIFDMNLSN